MPIANHHLKRKSIAFIATLITLASLLAVSLLTVSVNASGIIGVSSNIAEVPGGADLRLVVRAQNDGDVHELEIDHSFEGTLPEFSVYANEANPYGGQTCGGSGANLDCRTEFENAGVSVSYSEAESQWVIDFGPTITQVIRDNGGDVDFYFVLRDASGAELWGTMFGTTPDNTFNFDLIEGTGDVLVPVEVEDEEVIIPGVPNTSAVL